jgi:hypothetical protein
MKLTSIKIMLVLGCMAIIGSCGDDSINYREKLIGEWELKNVGELQSFFRNKAFSIKGATMKFEDSGLVETRMNSSSNINTWIVQNGTWTMPTTGQVLTIKAEDGPFDDALEIEFLDERTFDLFLNGLRYQFVKM